MEELFAASISALNSIQRDSLTTVQSNYLAEAIARLEHLSARSISIIAKNAELLAADPMVHAISREAMRELLVEAAKTNPDLRPIVAALDKMVHIGTVSAHNLGDDPSSDDMSPDLRLLLAETESAYHDFWIVKQRLNHLPMLRGFDPIGVRNVRNHLIEHVDKEGSGAHIYSIGLATRGPVLRAIRPTGISAPNDAGFETNVQEFLTKLVDRLSQPWVQKA